MTDTLSNKDRTERPHPTGNGKSGAVYFRGNFAS